MNEYILEMKDIDKSFFDVKVLDKAQLKVKPGEVHVLLGENGAGKSTLIKILSGAYSREFGEIRLEGKLLPPMTPKEALDAGISVIYQEFNLVPFLPVYENIFMGKEYGGKFLVDKKTSIIEAQKYMNRIGLNVSPKTLVSSLSVAQKQLVEIAKAISNHVKVLVLDEPTAAITDKESKMLFEIIRQLQKEGIGIIYISHRMSELFEIGNCCTVMRDGSYVGTVQMSDTNEDELTKLMVGRTVNFDKAQISAADKKKVVLSVKGLCYKNQLKNISFDLHKGEILGFAGLVGAGRTETAKCIMGAYKKTSGDITYKGEPVSHVLADNIENGMVYLSEDRKEEGLVLMHSVMDNIALPNLKILANPFINRKRMVEESIHYMNSLRVKANSYLTEAKNLSGGNQQKVVIAKWLFSKAEVYIFDEPTRGIDVGARDEIYNIMYDLVKKGASIIMISSDLVEVRKMCDRVAIMRDGKLEAVFENDEKLTQEKILTYALQGGE